MAMSLIRFEQLMKDTEKKRKVARRKWFMANFSAIYENPSVIKDEVPKTAILLRKKIDDLRREVYLMGKEEARVNAELRKKCKEICSELLGPGKPIPKELLERGPMYPVPQDMLDILFTGISYYGEGRFGYLKLRNNMAPENKFYEPITTSQLYGWKVVEKADPAMKEHCRMAVIKKSFYRRAGTIKPDSDKKRPPNPVEQITVETL